jgi:hypothetical protein
MWILARAMCVSTDSACPPKWVTIPDGLARRNLGQLARSAFAEHLRAAHGVSQAFCCFGVIGDVLHSAHDDGSRWHRLRIVDDRPSHVVQHIALSSSTLHLHALAAGHQLLPAPRP